MLNALFLPFAAMPATIQYDPQSPSKFEGFTLHYDERALNVRVGKAGGSFEIEIQGFDGVFGPHMVEVTKGQWVIESGADCSMYTAVIADDRRLLFAEIPTEDEARKVLQLIDQIIRTRQRHARMIQGFVDLYGNALQCEWQHDTSSLHIHGRRGNVSVYNINNLVLVYLQSDNEPRIFEQYLSLEFAPSQNPGASYVLSYDGKHFPGAEYVEDEIYMFCFRFPDDEAQIRMLVEAAVGVIKANA
jgi:hypothetical protein